jgi:hypothetical protein
VRNLLLSGIALLVSAVPAMAQISGLSGGGISGLSGGGLSGGGLSSSTLGGSGILGGSGSFIGGSTGSASGGSFLGATSGTSTSRTGSGTQSVGSTSFMGPYFGNPLSLGIPNSSGTLPTSPTFGTLLYTVSGSSGTNSTYAGLGGASGSIGGTATTTTGAPGGSSYGVRRAPAYTTTLGFKYNPEPPARVQSDLQQSLSHSDRLPSRDGIRVEVDGSTVVLRGTVTDDHERRLAEALARLTPGVRDLRNELNVRGNTGP